MAAVTPLEEQITCAVCFDICRNPHALRCLHTFCFQCIEQLQKSASDSTVQCPECRDFSRSESIKKDFKTQAFIDFYHQHTAEKQQSSSVQNPNSSGETSPLSPVQPPLLYCEVCDNKKQVVKFRCDECDVFICGACEAGHKKNKAFKSHKIRLVEAENHIQAKLQKAMNNLEEEKHHMASKCLLMSDVIAAIRNNKEKQCADVDVFINELLVEIELHREKIQSFVKSGSDSYVNSLTAAKEMYENTLTDISGKIDYLSEMLQSDDISTLTETLIYLDANIKEVEEMKSRLPEVNTDLKSPVRIRKGAKLDMRSLLDARFTSMDSGSLTLTLDVDYINREASFTNPANSTGSTAATNPVNSNSTTTPNNKTAPKPSYPHTSRQQGRTSPPSNNSSTVASTAEAQPQNDNLAIASTSTQEPVSSAGATASSKATTNVDFSSLVSYSYSQEKAIKLEFYPRALTLIRNELWCVADNTIHVFNKDCAQVNEINLKQHKIQYARSLTRCHRGNIVIACSDNQGLVHVDIKGQYLGRIMEGSFSYVCSYNKRLYTLNYKNGKIIVLANRKNKWTVVQEIKLNFGNTQSFDRLSVHSSGIYISSCLNNSLYVYDNNSEGTFQHQAGSDSGLKIPLMCGVDSVGNVLIADCDNHRMQVYDKSHLWHPLALPGQLKYPTDAVVDDYGSHLYVITSPPNQLIKYTKAGGESPEHS